MKIKQISSWTDLKKEFETTLSAVESLKEQQHPSYVPNTLFRGHNDSRWLLETTLDRIEKNFNCYKYYKVLRRIALYIESFTEKKWEIPKFNEDQPEGFWQTPEGYEFMAYLRHHQFPSPLLDWTRSPYLATFFAFSPEPSYDSVAIFAYMETTGDGKGHFGGNPLITSLGPNIKTHTRHYLQQSEYTICTVVEKKEKKYCSHEKVFEKDTGEQDLLTKCIIPISERAAILKDLDMMNINAYSLFQTEESLINTLAMREFIIKNL